ncbi:MAG TPA: nodulation protein NfeD [Candidatus Xenobia bacterium]|nr:nodulation protein NfeD [Candidatus Xenobia bacterium]
MKRLLLSASLCLVLAAPAAASTVVEIRLDEIIHSVSAEYVIAGLDHAAKVNADAVLIVIDTPGGLSDSMRRIVDRITASPVPVIVYVSPTGAHAASAGFFILLAADVAVMAPGSTTGAAAPVLGLQEMPETLKKKVTNDAAAYLRSYVGKRGRNVEVAELAVTEAKAFTDQEALKQGLIDAIVENRDQLLAQFNGREIKRFDGRPETLKLADARVEPWEMTRRQEFLSRLLDPNIAFLLLVFGILGLSIEINHPGMIFPGVAGGICIVLALFSLHLLPVNYVAVLLILLGFALFILEAKFVSHGILATGGVVAMVLGAMFLIESPPIPELRVRWEVALSVALPLAVITVIILRYAWKSFRWRVASGREALVGQIGEVRREIADGHKGMVLVAGELWEAVARRPIAEGERVRVVSAQGLLLEVEPFTGGWSASAPPEKE